METLISEPFYSFLFIGVGLLFLFLEVFIPSGGILGLLSLGCTAFGIYGLFHQGHAVLAVSAMAFVALLTVLGIRFGLQRLSFRGSLPPEVSTSVDERIESLLGKEGVTYTALRPAGIVIIDGKKVDVMTAGDFVEKDIMVRVIDNTGNRVVVCVVPPAENAESSENPEDHGNA